jgi:hypothetical protein
VHSDGHTRRLELSEIQDPRVLASMARVDAMSDKEIRELAHGEHPMMIEAAEGVIARRHSGEPRAD